MAGQRIERSHGVGSPDRTSPAPPEVTPRTGARQAPARAQSPMLDALARNRPRTRAGTLSRAGRTANLPPQTTVIDSLTHAIEAKKTVDMALRDGRAWQTLAGGSGPGFTDTDEALRATDGVIASARSGLDALEQANDMGLEPPSGYDNAKVEMIGFVLQAAEFAIVVLNNQFEKWNTSGFTIAMPPPGIEAATENQQHAPGAHDRAQSSSTSTGRQLPSSTMVAAIGTALAEMTSKRDKLPAYEKIARDFPAWLKQGANHSYLQRHETKMKLTRRLAQSVTRGMNVRILELNVERLKLSGLQLAPILDRTGAKTIRQFDDNPELHKAWDDIGQAEDLDPDQLGKAKSIALPHLHGINVFSDELCLEAANMIEMNDASDLWRYALDMAGAFKTYASCLRGLCDEARAGRPLPGNELAAPQASASPGTGASSSSQSRRTEGAPGTAQPPKNRQGSAAPRNAPAVPEHPVEASAAAAGPRVNYREIVERAGANVISVAHELGKDAHTLELMQDPMFDPVDAAQFARKSAESWFGDTGKLRKAIGKARASGPANDNRIDALSDRLEALRLVQGSIAATESDAIKRLARPEEKHLKQLLQLKEIARIDPPVRLPSDGDVGDKGTLFESRIELKPLSNGERARPLFIHLHTSKLVDSEAARTLPFKALTAIHVKTEAQRALGAKWEQIANASGAVHRGTIRSSSLLGELRSYRPPA